MGAVPISKGVKRPTAFADKQQQIAPPLRLTHQVVGLHKVVLGGPFA